METVSTADATEEATRLLWMIGSDMAGDRAADLWGDDDPLYRPRQHTHTYPDGDTVLSARVQVSLGTVDGRSTKSTDTAEIQPIGYRPDDFD